MTDGAHLEISTEVRGETTILRPMGDIDLSRSPTLRTELARVQQSRPSRLIVNLSDVPYMDSSGVATLVEAMKESRKHASSLVLCSMQSRVRSIFEIARLDIVFNIVDDLDSALNA
jgi:anti-sigma B factor antagonist